MFMSRLILILVALISNLVSLSDSQQPLLNIFLLAGQSNMSGQGGVVKNKWDGVVPPECRPDPLILRLSPTLNWELAQEPLHAGIENENVTSGVGPGMPFANAILRTSPEVAGVVGLVPCGFAGSKIAQWARGSELYNRLVKRARKAVESGGVLGALVWYQGESDSMSESDAFAYKGRLHTFFTNLRTDLQSPDLLIIQVALASGGKHYTETVREAQLHSNDLPNVICVDAKGLPLERDNLHLTTAGQVSLGAMLADAFSSQALLNV